MHHIIKGSFGLIHIVTFSKMFQVNLDLINSVSDNLENFSFQLFKKQQYLYRPQISFVKVNFYLSPIWNHLCSEAKSWEVALWKRGNCQFVSPWDKLDKKGD